MDFDTDSGTLIGLMQNFGGQAQAGSGNGNGNGINLLALDPSATPPTWKVRRLANLEAPNWDVMGNSGDVHSYDAETGMFYAVFASGEENPVRIAKIDWAAGWLLSNPLIENAAGKPADAIMQMAFAGKTKIKIKTDDDSSDGWSQSFRAGYNDSHHKWAGGSEIKHVVAHQGQLFAGNGYWMDSQPNWTGLGKTSQVLIDFLFL